METVTFRELKEAINNMPSALLDKPIVTWFLGREGGMRIVKLDILTENYLYDGDEGCIAESEMKENYEDFNENKDEYSVVHPKGTIILVTE